MATPARGPAPAPPAAPVAPSVDENLVAEFLLRKKFFLSALELHQELQEGNNGIHGVAALNRFFNDQATYTSLVKRVADEEARNKAQCTLPFRHSVNCFSQV